MVEISLSIIGTTGRKDDNVKLTEKHFRAMCIVAEGLIEQLKESNYPISHLISGGAAFADHCAVRLFLEKKVLNLKLFIPAKWDNGAFYDNGKEKSFENAGRTCNYYHKLFLNKTGIHSLSEIQVAKNEGAELIEISKGFHARNSLVAKSDFLLAMTFGDGKVVKDGGTANTVEKYLTRIKKEGIFDKSFHYDLNSGKIYSGCIVPLKEKTVPLVQYPGYKAQPAGHRLKLPSFP